MPNRRAIAVSLVGVAVLLHSACSSSRMPVDAPSEAQANTAEPAPGPGASPAHRPRSTAPPGTAAAPLGTPPPAGISTVVPVPVDRLRERRVSTFGLDVDLAVGSDDQPVVVFTVADPSSRLSSLQVTKWDGVEQTWSKPIELQRSPLLPSLGGSRPFDVAADRGGSVVAIVVENQDERGRSIGATLHLSEDGGRSWTRHVVAKGEATSPSVAVAGTMAFVAYRQDDSTLVAAASVTSAELDWSTQIAPIPPGFGPSSSPAAIAAIGSQVGLLYPVSATAGTSTELLWWRPSGTRQGDTSDDQNPTRVLTTNDPQMLTPVAAALDDETDTALAAVAVRDASGYSQISLSRSRDGGRTWSPAERPAPDAPSSSVAGLSLAALRGHTAMAWVPITSSGSTDSCGLPKLAVAESDATNPTRWVTCRAPGAPTVGRFEDINPHPEVAFGPRGDLYLSFAYWGPPIDAEPGVLLWRGSVDEVAKTPG